MDDISATLIYFVYKSTLGKLIYGVFISKVLSPKRIVKLDYNHSLISKLTVVNL